MVDRDRRRAARPRPARRPRRSTTPGPRRSRPSSAPDHVAGGVAGRATRILLDAGRIDSDTTAHRMGRRLSLAASAPAGRRLARRLPGRRRGAAGPRRHAAGAGRRVGQRARRGRRSRTCCRSCAVRSPASARPSAAPSASSSRASARPGESRRDGRAAGSTSSRPDRRCTPWPGSSAGRWWRMTEQPEQPRRGRRRDRLTRWRLILGGQEADGLSGAGGESVALDRGRRPPRRRPVRAVRR